MPYHSSLSIANEFLRRARTEGRELTQMHLQKLVYLAHGWTLAVTGRPLIEDRFEAWDYGPVVRKLYDALRHYGSGSVERLIRAGEHGGFGPESDDAEQEELTLDEASVIDRVWAEYKEFEAFQLSALTHADDSPWHRTFAEGSGRSRVISDDSIWDHFANLAARHG